MRAIGRICAVLVVLGSLWALSDAFFSLEYSWLLFLYRVLAPVGVVALLIAFVSQRVLSRVRQQQLPSGSGIVWLALLCTAIAPILGSLAYVPTYTVHPPTDAPTLTIFNLNAFAFRNLSAGVIQEIEKRDPDIITLQELTPSLAEKLETRFSRAYNCRILRPSLRSAGMGTLAKNGCSERVAPQGGRWVGPPIIVETTAPTGAPLIVANFHALHPHAGLDARASVSANKNGVSLWRELSQPIFDRQASIDLLLNAIGEPKNRNILIAGDLNASMRNRVYASIRNAGYHDSWLDLHSVLSGGTWPAPEFMGGFGLGWLLRIDFLFRSESLLPTEIELLPETLGSDHRGIFGRFAVML